MTDRSSDELDWLYRRGAYAGDPEWEPVRVHRSTPHNQPATPPPAPVPPRTPGRRRRRRRRPLRNTAILLLAVTMVYLTMVPVVAWSMGSRVESTPEGERPAKQPGKLYLLAGSDSREALTASGRSQLAAESAGSRADTIMLLYVPVRGRPALVSIPSDSYLEIPGHGRNKVSAAYAFGGPQLLVETLEKRTGLRIDGYAEVGFEGFVDVIDAMGGIQMCPPKAIKDRESNLDIPAGCQHFDGRTALGYVRMRKADPAGDLGRVNRQREMVAAVAKEVASPSSFVDPVRYLRINQSLANTIVTGTDTGILDVSKLAVGLIQLSGDDGLTVTVPISDTVPTSDTVPISGAGAYPAAGSAVLWDDEAADEMFGEIARGDTSDLDRFKR